MLLPSDDDGLVELPSDACDNGDASSSQGIAKRRRRGPAQRPRGDHPRDVIPGHSSEVTRLECVARDLLREHGKDAVFMITDRLREAFAPNITLTELQDIGGEDLIITLVQIAAENGVEPPSLLNMSADAVRACEE